MSKELYIKGDDKLVNEIIEIVRPLIGKNKIWIVDIMPQILPDGLKCSCGQEVELTCQDCGESGDIKHFEQFSKDGDKE